jgi:hypothetical protein
MSTTSNSQEQGNARITAFYRSVFCANLVFIVWWWNLVKAIGGFFQIIPAVFLRKNMGERYYSTTNVRIWIVILIFLPPLYAKIDSSLMDLLDFDFYKPIYNPLLSRIGTWYGYGTWYAFIVLFAYFATQRRKEIKRSRSSFDRSNFSKYSGDIEEFTERWGYKLFGMANDTRKIETIVEPLIIAVVGLGLWILNQKIGGFLIITSVFYAWSYWAAYRIGDNAMLNILDENYLKRQLSQIVHESGKLFRGGARLFGRFPKNLDDQKDFVDTITGSKNSGFTEAV